MNDAKNSLVAAFVVIFGWSIATDEEHEEVTKRVGLVLRFMKNMGYEFKKVKRKTKNEHTNRRNS